MWRHERGIPVWSEGISAPWCRWQITFYRNFVSGSRLLLLDMKPYLDKIRFRTLTDPQVWDSAVTNGIFVRFGNVELSHDELLSMAEREH